MSVRRKKEGREVKMMEVGVDVGCELLCGC